MAFDNKLDLELKELVERNPKNYIKVLSSTGKKCNSKDRKHLRDYIAEATPLLKDSMYSLRTKLYWVLNHIESWNDPRVRCKNPKCHTPNGTPFIGMNVKKLSAGYVQSCCKQCERDLAQASLEARMLARHGVKNPFQMQSVKEKIAGQAAAIAEKKNSSYRKHGTFKSSEKEDEAYSLLLAKFPDIVRSYRCPEYPFTCDFFIPSLKMFIEFNGTWTHGGKPYEENDASCQMQLAKWKELAKESRYYANAIDTWTVRDVKKREVASANKLDYKTFWRISELKAWLDSFKSYEKTLAVQWDSKKARLEKKHFDEALVDIERLPLHNSHNYIVKYFQQDVLYAKEKALWHDDAIRQKLISNRCKYLGKPEAELTDLELLDGFKKSGLSYGYSHFNPLLFKWFIKRYSAKVCYDPCGGWGHRLLGASDLELYLYNDKSPTVKSNVDKIIKHFSIKNCKTSCVDARDYMPMDSFDCMFTCPPYFNLEKYECGGFADEDEFKAFIDALFNIFMKKDFCKTFGLVIREDMLYGHDDYIGKFQTTVERENYLAKSSKCNKEFLFVFKKQDCIASPSF